MAVVPVDGVVLPAAGVTSFGYQRSATHRHQGIDLHAPLGAPVRSAVGGVVTHAVTVPRRGFSGYGRVLVIAGGGVHCLYAHLDQLFAERGDQVHAGQVVATVGRTCGTVEEPGRLCSRSHLHFEVSAQPYPQPSEAPRLDPVAWLGDDQWTRAQALVVAAAVAFAAYLVDRWKPSL